MTEPSPPPRRLNGPTPTPGEESGQAASGTPSWLGKVLASLLAGVVLLVGIFFSVIAFGLIAVLALGAIGWFWWKTRALRRALKEARASGATPWSPQPSPDSEPAPTPDPRTRRRPEPSRTIDGEVLGRELDPPK